MKNLLSHAQNNPFFAFIHAQPGTTLELNLFEAGKVTIEASYRKNKTTKTIDHKNYQTLTGEMKFFNNKSQHVIFHNLRGMSGEASLQVDDLEMRRKLLDAQRDNLSAKVTFAPAVDPLHPEKKPRSGLLINIDAIGPANLFALLSPDDA